MTTQNNTTVDPFTETAESVTDSFDFEVTDQEALDFLDALFGSGEHVEFPAEDGEGTETYRITPKGRAALKASEYGISFEEFEEIYNLCAIDFGAEVIKDYMEKIEAELTKAEANGLEGEELMRHGDFFAAGLIVSDYASLVEHGAL